VFARRLLILLLPALASFAAPAGAIPNTCPTTGPDAGVVNITEPTPGATFAGLVTVRGRASSPSPLSKVELFVGEALKDFIVVDPPRPNVDFLVRFDAAGVQSNRPVVTVVACGGSGSAAVRGIASIEVAVDRPSVATRPPISITPVERTAARPGSNDRTGPAWVGAAFGLAGMAGVLAATRVRRARVATAPSPGAGAGQAAGPARRRRRPPAPAAPPAPAGGVAPPRPTRPRRTAWDPSEDAPEPREGAAPQEPARERRRPHAGGDGRRSPRR
jgi:hypothetical protein